MFDNLIITGTDKIINFLKKLDIDIFLTPPQIKHVIAFMCTMVLKGYNGKVSDVPELIPHRHRRCPINEKALKVFIGLDPDMDTKPLLNHYVHRWAIEIFFRESKRRLDLHDYQVRSERSIRTYFILLMLTYVYCGLEVSCGTLNFSKGIKIARKEVRRNQVAWIYNQAQVGASLEQVFQTLNVA